MKILLKNARLAFPVLFTPQTVNGEGEPAFSASFLIEKNHPQIAEINAAMLEAAKGKWGAKGQEFFDRAKAADKVALHNGDLKNEYEGFSGMLYISSRNKTRPTVFDKDRTPLVVSDGKPYAGCYVNASIEFWAQDNKYGKRINASLRGVQFVRDGDAFSGGGAASEDEFESLDSEAEDFV